MIKAEFPRSLDGEVQFWDRYSLRDLGRICVPAVIGRYMAGAPGLLAGLLVGFLTAEWKPHGKHLDEHLANYVAHAANGTHHSGKSIKKKFSRVAVIEDDTVIGIVKASSTDISTVSEREQKANRDTVYDLFNSTGRVEIYSRQHTVDLSDFQGASGSAVATDHYIVVKQSSRPDTDLKQQVEQVDERCVEVRNALTAADLRARRLTEGELYNALEKLDNGQARLFRRHYRVKRDRKPVHRTVCITGYPDRLEMGWLAEILNVEAPGMVDVNQVARPISPSQRNWINRMISRLEIEQEATRSPARQIQLQRQQEDAENLVDAEASGETLVNYKVFIVARGQNRKEADATLKAVKSTLNRLRIEFREPVLRMGSAVKAESPFHYTSLGTSLTVPGRSAAAGYPFAASNLIENEGIVVGHDLQAGKPAVLNRFNWEAGHTAVTGKNGSGKTYWTSLTLLRSYNAYNDLDIYVIDPKKRDYGKLVDALNGKTITLDNIELSGVEPGDVTRYTVEDPSRDNTELLVDAVRHVYRQAAKTDSKSLVVIDEAHRIITSGNQTCEDGIQAVSALIRESRDQDVAVSLVTQNVDDLTRSNEGRNLLRNINCYVFFKQQEVQTEAENFFDFSQSEKVELTKLQTGTRLPFSKALIRGPVNTTLRIESTDTEHQIIKYGRIADGGTNPENKESSEQPQKNRSKTRNKKKTSKTRRTGLLSAIATVSNRSIKAFEPFLVSTTLFAAILFNNSVIKFSQIAPYDPVGVLPVEGSLIEFLGLWLGVIIAVELLWVLILGIEVATASSQTQQ